MMHLKNFFLTFVIFIFLATSLSARNLDSLENVLRQKITNDDVYVQLDGYFDLGKAYLDHQKADQALEYLLAAEALATKLKKIDLRKKIQYKIGLCYSKQHEYDEAIETFTNLINEISSDGGKPFANACYRLARIYQVIGNYELSFDYHIKALQIRKDLKDEKGVAFSLYQIGGIHFFQGSYHKSIEYYEKCLKISEKIDHVVLQLSCFGAIGGAYSRLNEVERSLEYNLKAYELSKSSNSPSSIITFNLGDNYQVKGDLELALKYFNESHKLNIEANDRWGQIASTKAIGEIHISKGEEEKGLERLMESLTLARTLGAKPILLDVYKSLARNLENIGQHEEANNYYRNFILLKDSLHNEATLQKMSDTEVQQEMTQKERDIQKKSLELQNMYRNFLIVGLLALMVILWQLHTKYKTQTEHNNFQREKNQKIQQQNEELEKVHLKQVETNQLLTDQNEKILVQNKSLEVKNEELQRFAYIASHDLKEPLRNIGSFATLLKRRFKGQLGTDADEYIDFITTNVSRMYDLLHEVLMYSKLENEEVQLEEVHLNETVSTVLDTLKGKIMEGNVHFNIGDLPVVKGHKSHLLQLFQNLVSNSIKYNKDVDPIVDVGVKRNYEGHDLVYFVKDNGIGIDMEFKERIFEIFKRLHGKDEFEGTGVGLAICKKIVNSNNGDIWLDSEIGKGATFYFTLNIETRFESEEEINAGVGMQGVALN